MEIQQILILGLSVAVVVLAVLLVWRHRRERRTESLLQRMDLSEFSDFLVTNSKEGTIGDVARRVSNLLIKTCGCDRILFLRKKRRFLELNYYYGLTKFDRRDFRLAANPKLTRALYAGFTPRPVTDLQEILPQQYMPLLNKYNLDLFFPVFWRDNLYGVYFIKNNFLTESSEFRLLVAQLAQSLSAAYHVKWHESRQEQLQKKIENPTPSRAEPRQTTAVEGARLLKLVKHRSAETIVPKLIGSIKEDLNINRIAYIWREGDNRETPPRMIQEGIDRAINLPKQAGFEKLVEAVDNGRPIPIESLLKSQPAVHAWAKALQDSGLHQVMSFPLADNRPGVLALSTGQKPARDLQKKIDTVCEHARDLFENAVTFERIEEMSYTDNLTGLANQRYFRRRLDEEIQRAKRYKRELALIIFDLDQLKAINDKHGHLAGDAVLKQVGTILRKSIRAIDIIARYGGDEFCIIMPEADTDTCRKFMERLRREVARVGFTIENIPDPLNFTISLGGAVLPTHAEDGDQLVHLADMALLKAKEAGRDTCCLYDASVAQK